MKTAYAEEDGKEFLIHRDDIAPHLERAHALRSAKVRKEATGEFHHAMTIPNVVVVDIMNKTGLDFFNKDHWPEIKKILKRPEYAVFKTTPHEIF